LGNADTRVSASWTFSLSFQYLQRGRKGKGDVKLAEVAGLLDWTLFLRDFIFLPAATLSDKAEMKGGMRRIDGPTNISNSRSIPYYLFLPKALQFVQP